VIIVAGTNDISRDVDRGRTVNEYEVVENLMKIARKAREVGAETVHVSAIIVRHGYQYKNPVKRVNNLLEATCVSEGFLFMDQSEISSSHIAKDGVHLNFYGITLLKMNILSCFHTFNPYLTDFEYDYDRALF
jgi:lysophospholipase L1-like esterase